jgi:prohibitin 1
LIEAKGTRDAQLVLSEGLTEEILRLRQIEMMGALTQSQNAKVIVTNGDPNVMINEK